MKQIFTLTFLMLLASCNETTSLKNEAQKQHAQILKPHFIKSAHYFSSAWPKTFWQEFEEADVASELAQIKSDGFNTIVLTVPWRGFETDFQNKQTTSNPLLYERLKFLLKSIKDQNLFYMLRVGFPHDYTPNTGTDIVSQCTGIYTDKKMQKHWANYIQKIERITRPYHDSSVGTLVSWEDFWCPHFVFPNLNEEKRLNLAKQMGYGEWLKTKNINIVKVMLKENDLKFNEVKVPQPSDLSYVLYLDFIDDMLEKQVLEPLKSTFTDASLEIRVDKLPIKQRDHYTWISHDLMLKETNHRGSYWAPFWGAENKGELLTADVALKNFKYFLKVVSNEGKNINHIIEQFNFYDNTPYFPNNANIHPDEIGVFLLKSAPLLKQFSLGFGVWAYRDYQDNALYNSSFELGITGWEVKGQVNTIKHKGAQSIELQSGALMSQDIPAHKRMMFVSAYKNLDLCLSANQTAGLEISIMAEEPIHWQLNEGKNCIQLPAQPFQGNKITKFNLKAISPVQIDEIKLSGFTQKLGLYDAYGNQGTNIDAYRKLNDMFK